MKLANPGAAVTVYYAYFKVTLQSVTYQYPYQLQVTWEDPASPTPSSSQSSSPTPTPAKPSGDFDIIQPTISYREPFKLVPKDFQIPNSCVYKSHTFRMSSSAGSWTSAPQTGQTQELSFTYDTYPSPVIVGAVSVSMQLSTTCGPSDWVSHTITVKGPANNSPPYFKIGWFKDGDFSSKTPLTQVVQGTKLLVRIVEDPASNPPSPSDPEGDTFSTTGWDYNTSPFVQSLPDKYNFYPRADYLPGITMDTIGFQRIGMTMADTFGAAYTAYTMVEVVPPNPIAVPACPKTVKENRLIPDSAFDASQSYSPLGQDIDHSRDEWINKQTSYPNGTLQDRTATVTLHVWDKGNPALKSLQAGSCTITITPDYPPITVLEVPPLDIRGQAVELYNKSTSPDGDGIVSASYRYKYDSSNNGFADDTWQPLSGTLLKAAFTPMKVGKYLFDVNVCEEYGKCAQASDTQPEGSRTMDVVNLAPTVKFTVEGENKNQPFNPVVSYNAQAMLGWRLFQTNSNTLIPSRVMGWSAANGRLQAGLGRAVGGVDTYNFSYTSSGREYLKHFVSAYSNSGYGHNGISPYRALKTQTWSEPIPTLGSPEGKPLKLGGSPSVKVSRSKVFIGNLGTNTGYSDAVLYILDKSKLGNAVGAAINRSAYDYTWGYTYEKGSPVWTVFSKNNVNTPEFGPVPQLYSYNYWTGDGKIGYINTSYKHGYYDIDFLGFQVSERTLFVKVLYRYRNLIKENDSNRDLYVADLRAYDAETGSFLWSTALNETNPFSRFNTALKVGDQWVSGSDSWPLSEGYAFTVGDTLVTWAFGKLVQIDRSGTVIRSADYPYISYSDESGSHASYVARGFQGYDGSLYFLEGQRNSFSSGGTSYTNNADGTHLVKFNSDLSFAWRVDLAGKQLTPAGSMAGEWSDRGDYQPYLVENPVRQELLVRSCTISYMSCPLEYQKVDARTGAVGTFDTTPYDGGWILASVSPFGIDANGNYVKESNGNGIHTIDGSLTVAGQKVYRNQSLAGTLTGGGVVNMGFGFVSSTNVSLGGTYIGDGIYLNFYSVGDTYNPDTPYFVPWIIGGEPDPSPRVSSLNQLGQYVSDSSFANGDLSFSWNMEQPSDTKELTGFSFRMQDPRNRYALETDGATLILSKYVNGSRTVLQQTNVPFQAGENYTFKVSLAHDNIHVFMKGVPYFEVQDGTFTTGKFGYFTDKPFVSFGSVGSQVIPPPSVAWLTNYAIWNEAVTAATVRYPEIAFTDPENDPQAGASQWFIRHTPKFLNHQGLSALDGQSRTSPSLQFDKVGVYQITLKAEDDPNPSYLWPSMTFDSYRKWSISYQQLLIVHRRPVAVMSPAVNPDGTISYADASYDPDRYDPAAGVWSPPDTPGMDYSKDRGITERKYYYIDPDGSYVERQLVRPAKQGAYEVGLMVKDEYGAWSSPVTAVIQATLLPPSNQPPVAALVSPNGTAQAPTLIYLTKPIIVWRQTDADPGTLFTAYHVRLLTQDGAPAPSSGEQAQSTVSTWGYWTVPIDLVRGSLYQVQVQVKDSAGEWSDWSGIGWMRINAKPTALITSPVGTLTAPAVLFNQRRPIVQWLQTDGERPYFKKLHLEIRDQSGVLVYTTGPDYVQNSASTSSSLRVPVNLPTGTLLQARLRVTDDEDTLWSDWSNEVWFRINGPPSAEILDPAGTKARPAFAGVTPRIEWSQTDADPGAQFSAYQLRIRREDGSVVLDTGVTAKGSSETRGAYQVTSPLPAGLLLQADVRVWDQDGAASAWSAVQWFRTNRPPAAAFDWRPKPLWEGDAGELFSTSADPDGNPLTYQWTVLEPDGRVRRSEAGPAWTMAWTLAGAYQATLTVSDGYESASVTHTVHVLPLTIAPTIRHTPDWRKRHVELGHETERDPLDFYSGEKVLVALTSAPAPVRQATAVLEAVAADGTPVRLEAELQAEPTLGSNVFGGELYDPKLGTLEGRLPNGRYTVRFSVLYENGVRKDADLPLTIIGPILEAAGVHRVQ